MVPSLLASSQGSSSPLLSIIYLVVVIAAIVGMWKVYEKADQPGWASIIPFYNIYIMLKIAGRPGWWLILFFIPFVNVVTIAIVAIDIAKAFGKGTAFGIFGLWLFSFIGYMILGFGDAEYQGVPKHQ